MFESKNRYYGRKRGKSFVRLEHLQSRLLLPTKNIFEKIHYGLNFDRSILIKNITNTKSKLSWDNFVEKLLNNI